MIVLIPSNLVEQLTIIQNVESLQVEKNVRDEV